MSNEPDAVTALADELLDVMFTAEPLGATLLGLPGYDDQLPNVRAEDETALRARLADIRARALDLPDCLTKSVLVQQVDGTLDRIESGLVEFTISDQFTSPAAGILFMFPMIQLPDERHGRDYLARLAGIPDYLAAVIERHRAGLERGRIPVAHLVRAAIEHLDRYLADPDADPLTKPVPPGDAASFVRARDELLSELVRPAFAGYRRMLQVEVEPVARPAERPGLCWLPDGTAAYESLIRAHTTTSRSAEELHRTGLDLIAELRDEYLTIGSRVFGVNSLPEVFERLRTDPRLRWNSGEELLTAARQAITRAEDAAPRWFGRVPEQRCVVEPVPASEAPGAPGAYYMRPALDGSRPGTYYANTYQAQERFRHVCEATAFHEAVPGHHMQLSLAGELESLPLLRRLAPFTAYSEGWALYCERLADEMGLYSDDVALLGMLTEDSMRAGRLVVDTGLHALGWTRQQAVDYLLENTPMAAVEIDSEVDRYIADPGQALAYMVGRLEIQRLRAEAERQLGDAFDIRAFHDVVLGSGGLPMTVLGDVVRDWVRSSLAETG